MSDVSICICTFRRPELLRRLLIAIHAQEETSMSVQVVVIDNDPQHSAAQVLSDMQTIYGDRLTFASLAQPNISLARNAAIGLATGKWIVMVDDDEYPQSDWLKQLFHQQHKQAADVVFAPVLPEYADNTPAWIKKGKYFDRRRLPSGTTIGHKDARSGNVLVRRSVLDSIFSGAEGPFDPAYGRSGGEDSMLFRQMAASGAKMIWCDEAPVYEYVPLERATAFWLLQRSFRTGQLFMRTELETSDPAHRRRRALFLSFKAIAQMGVAFILALICVLFSPLKAFHWLRTCVSQLGKLNHFRGKFQEAYGL
ncbi:glycosyltransferase [Undibacterium sp. SXout7W]|uniref:glycosyltransferase n=1 Tax=Undibacterium sp. SXout7W TaxID=3413049 RepID=UPI003BF22A51